MKKKKRQPIHCTIEKITMQDDDGIHRWYRVSVKHGIWDELDKKELLKIIDEEITFD